MKKKFNPELLKEELNRFRLLNEYDFYQEKKEIPEYKDLILGDTPLEEADEAPEDLAPEGDADAEANAIGDELGVDADSEGDDEFGGELDDSEPEPEPEPEAEPLPEPEAEPADDATEVDVTSLVKGSEEAKQAAESAANAANQNSHVLMQKLDNLEARFANMDMISDKIETLEKEIIKRNPTPVEKLEMRSLDSYPFNQKLSDYWADKEGAYDVMGNKEKEKKEYVLTKDDVDAGYSDADVKKSFSVDYDEEDMDGDDYDEENV